MNEDWLELSPKEKEEKEDKKDEKKPYSVDQKLMESRTITIYGGIDQKLAKDVCQRLLALATESDDPIKLYLHSQGGHVESGDSIFDMIRFIKPEVKIVGTGWVASAGALIFAAADKKNRFCMPNTRFLLHQPSGGVMGQATDIGIEAKEIVKMRRRLNEIFADATGQPIEQIEKQTDRNFWMTADEAVKYGLVTKIVKSADEVK